MVGNDDAGARYVPCTEKQVSDECSGDQAREREYMGLHKRTKAMIEDRGSDADKKKLARLEEPTVH